MLKPGWTTEYPVSLPASAAAKTDALYEIAIPYSAEMQVDFDDVRFIDNDGTQLEQVRKEYTSGVESTWVFLVPNKPIPGKTIYLCTGRDVAELLSDLALTFNDILSDPANYNTDGVLQEDGSILLSSLESNWGYITSTAKFGLDSILVAVVEESGYLHYCNIGYSNDYAESDEGYAIAAGTPWWYSRDGVEKTSATDIDDNSEHTVMITRLTGPSTRFSMDGVEEAVHTNVETTTHSINISVMASSIPGSGRTQNFSVKKMYMVGTDEVVDLGSYEILEDLDTDTGETLTSDVDLNSYISEIKHDANLVNLKNKIPNTYIFDAANKDIQNAVAMLGPAINQRYKKIIPIAITDSYGAAHASISHASGSTDVTGFSGLTDNEYENGVILVVESNILYRAKISGNDADTVVITLAADLPVLSGANVFVSVNNSGSVAGFSGKRVMQFAKPIWGVWDGSGRPISYLKSDMAPNISSVYGFNDKAYWYRRGENVIIALGSGATLSGHINIGVYLLPNELESGSENIDFPVEYRDIPQALTAARILQKVGRKKEAKHRIGYAANLINGITKRNIDKKSIELLIEG